MACWNYRWNVGLRCTNPPHAPSALQPPQHRLEQLFRLDRFREEVVHPRRHALGAVLGEGVGRHRDNRHLLAARQLADIGIRVAESSGSRSLLFDCHTLHLNLLRNAGTFENAPCHVNEVLRLFPDALDCPNRAAAAGLALYFAWSLAMNEQKDALYTMLSEGPWQGNDYVTQCAHMSMIQEFTTDYPEGIAWADKGLRYVSEQGNPNCLDAATLYKAKALFCALCGRTEEAEDSIANYKRIIRDWYDGVDFIELGNEKQEFVERKTDEVKLRNDIRQAKADLEAGWRPDVLMTED